MKSLKKSLVLLVVLSMVLSVVAPVFAFNDAIPEGYEDQVNKIAAMGVIAGDANGNFNAEKDITRAEMAVIICKMTGITESIADANKMTPSKFSDVAVGEWYTGWVNIAVNNGVISGFPDNTFRPNDKLTTNQALTLIVKALGRGAFVDKMGAWPGNYVQDAAKLGITKDMVATGSELANRGNVAIICYNALTVGTWDVTSTTLDGEVRLSTDDSLSAKYFQDFVASKKIDDNGKQGEIKYIKLLEDAVVTATALQEKEIGLRQIIIGADEDTTYGANSFDIQNTTVAAVIDASKAPRNNKEEATYKDNGNVVAYVPEEVYADVTSLNNKRIDVMFGKDNEVVMLIVVDDVVEDSYITAWDVSEGEIEINGEIYEVNDDAVVTLYGYELTHKADADAGIRYYGAIEALDHAIERTLGITVPNKVFNRTVKANIVLDEDGDIEKIDIIASQNYGNNAVPVEMNNETSMFLGMEEGIVKSISSKGVIKGYDGVTILSGRDIEDVEDKDEPRVIKDGAIASLEDIEVGDVVTAIYETTSKQATKETKTYSLVYVSSAKVTGTISRVKNDAITIDGEVYNTVKGILADKNGEIDEAKVVTTIADWKDYYNEDVEVYLNHVGEVSAIIATTEATDLTVGVLTRDASVRDDNDKDVTYLSVKLLTKDGSKKTYKVYNEDDDSDIEDAIKVFDNSNNNLYPEGTVVVFAANANGVIESDNFTKISKGSVGQVFDLDGKELTVLEVDSYSNSNKDAVIINVAINDDPNTAEINEAIKAKENRFSSSTTAYNVATAQGSEELGLIKKGWDALYSKSSGENQNITNAYMLVDKYNRIVYYIAEVASYLGTTNNYGLLVDIALETDEDDEKIYTATLFVDGENVKYELSSLNVTLDTISSIVDSNGEEVASEGYFVTYTLTNDKITAISTAAKVAVINDDKSADDSIDNLIPGLGNGYVKESLTVSDVVDKDIFFKDDIEAGKELELLVVDEDGCIIYDFRDGEYTMFEGTIEDLEGLLVYGFAADCDSAYVDTLIILD